MAFTDALMQHTQDEPNPHWDAEFFLPMVEAEEGGGLMGTLTLDLWDEEGLTRDQLVGHCHVDLSMFDTTERTDVTFPVEVGAGMGGLSMGWGVQGWVAWW